MDILIIEEGRGHIGFARFQKRGGALFFQGADRCSREDRESREEFLEGLAGAAGDGDDIILSLDPGKFFFREVELPIPDRRKQREVLPLELKGETALDTEGLVFDALPARDGKVFAVWAAREVLSARIGQLKEAGLEPRIAGSSLFSWNMLVPETTADGVAAISDGFSLAVFAGGQPVLFRALGEGDAVEEIARTLALLEAGRGISVERVFLHGCAVGESSRIPSGAARGIVFEPLPVSGELAASFPGGGTALEHAGAWALAHSALKGEPLNFRHGPLAYTAGRELLKRKLRLTALLAGLLLLLLMGETGLRFYFVHRDLSSLNKSIGQIYREVFPGRKKAVDEVSELKSEIRRLGGGVSSRNLLPAMNGIALAKGEDIGGAYELEIEGQQVVLKGDARSYQAVNDFKTRLAGLFTSSEVSEVKSRPDGSVSFSFRGTLAEETK